ncbi:chloride channel protein [Exiguobacterium sp. SH1S21]|uniref:chloride channel protein n=1 Tax=Exiguobacterium sp. SH1S21 TaxID=2510953 RepID=UPI001040E03D|nr:chloride channel protein [Exiguobacterium sp. SH1S21]TCI57629.1 chloride channel protein [Exiguobacterium sp. SH1S21]
MKSIIVSVYAVILGILIGFISWIFLSVVYKGIHFVWHTVPERVESPFYIFFVPLAAGVLIGLLQRRYGPMPRLMPEILEDRKTSGRIAYRYIGFTTLTALLVLIGGASLGPEAALIGIVGGLTTWFAERLRYVRHELSELQEVGHAVVLGIVFNAPLFGALAAEETEHKKQSMLNLLATLAGVGTFYLLNRLDERPPFVVKFPAIESIQFDWSILFIILFGMIFGWLYLLAEHALMRLTSQVPILFLTITGGIGIGTMALIYPDLLFSGEETILEYFNDWERIPLYTLLWFSFLKLFFTAFCLATGWRGGHIYPLLFSAFTLGYFFSGSFDLDPTFAVVLATSTLLATTMRQPLAIIVLLVLFFPPNSWVYVFGVVAIVSKIPLPAFIHPNVHN